MQLYEIEQLTDCKETSLCDSSRYGGKEYDPSLDVDYLTMECVLPVLINI